MSLNAVLLGVALPPETAFLDAGYGLALGPSRNDPVKFHLYFNLAAPCFDSEQYTLPGRADEPAYEAGQWTLCDFDFSSDLHRRPPAVSCIAQLFYTETVFV